METQSNFLPEVGTGYGRRGTITSILICFHRRCKFDPQDLRTWLLAEDDGQRPIKEVADQYAKWWFNRKKRREKS